MRLRQSIADRLDYYPRVNEAQSPRDSRTRAESLYRGLIAEYHEGISPVQMLEAQTGLPHYSRKKENSTRPIRNSAPRWPFWRAAVDGPCRADNRMSYFASLIRFYDSTSIFWSIGISRREPSKWPNRACALVLDERLESKSGPHYRPPANARSGAPRQRGLSLLLAGEADRFCGPSHPGGITLHELPPESEITSLVAGYRSFIGNLRDPLQSEYPAGRKLSEIFFVRCAPSSPRQPRGAGTGPFFAFAEFRDLPDPEIHRSI